MTDEEKKAMVLELVDNTITATAASVYLDLAAEKMLARLYPFKTNATLPSEYDITQCELASRLILRKGGQGEISHNENGVNRTYDSVDDEDILSRLTPFAEVI